MMDDVADRAGLQLYMTPDACSQVTMSALEEVGLEYDTHLIDTQAGEQKSPAYLSVNPKGKIPALRVGGRVMTENPAILWFLHRRHPRANLLPSSDDAVADSQGLIDLVWCASMLHPMVRQIRNPGRLTKAETAGVRDDGLEKFAQECGLFSERLSEGRWWYGSTWSIIDVYLQWLCSTAEKGGFPLPDYPELVDHRARVRARPSVRRALDREVAAVARRKAEAPAV